MPPPAHGLLCLALWMPITSVVAADLPFNPAKPGLLAPASVYSFPVSPKEGTPHAMVRLHTEATEDFKDSSGRAYAPVEKISVVHEGTEYYLDYEYENVGIPGVEIADFDGDGFNDFRMLSNWGTGGSWYCYYRFEDGKFHRWSEPEDLGINGLPADGLISADNRSGPESISVFYRFKDGIFQKQRVESILLKSSIPEMADLKGDDFLTVRITEEWDGDRLLRRTLEPQYGPP
ncbi:MAG: hypothetical protein IAE97_01990 [Chthoniobacterales bacterium]|nr:hypothetical protein [Chthoniobacterales bacterium]